MGSGVGRNLSAGRECASVETVPLFFNKIGKCNTLFFPFSEQIWKPELRRNLKIFSDESWGEENYVEHVRKKNSFLVWQ